MKSILSEIREMEEEGGGGRGEKRKMVEDNLLDSGNIGMFKAFLKIP